MRHNEHVYGNVPESAPSGECASEYVGEWVVAERSRHSTATVRAYASDVAAVLSAVHPPAQEVLVPDVPQVSGASALALALWERLWRSSAAVQVEELTPSVLSRSLDIAGAGKAPTSQRRMFAGVSNFCAHLYRYGVLPANPMTHPAVTRPRSSEQVPHPLPTTHVEAVLQAIVSVDEHSKHPFPARDTALAAVLIGTGVRVSETVSLKVGEWTPSGHDIGTLRVRGKGRKVRILPMSPEVESALEQYLQERGARFGTPSSEDALFVRGDGTAMSTEYVRRLVRRWYQRAGVRGVEGATVHAWRASFATLAVSGGTPLTVVQALLGHANLTTTQRYVGVAAVDTTDAVLAHASRTLLR